MIRHCQGDLLASGAEALVNPVNCVGVAGAGLAKAFRLRWPAAFECYKKNCEQGLFRPGTLQYYEPDDFKPDANPKIIICFPTKRHWRDSSRLEYITSGLSELATYLRWTRCSIAVPALGCGLGGLDWQDVRPLIEAALGDIGGLEVMLYGPQGKKERP